MVNARSPSNINDYARIWIECASGTPLQVDHYSVTDQPHLEHVARVTGMKWHHILTANRATRTWRHPVGVC